MRRRWLILLLCVTAVCACAPRASAALLFYDGFNPRDPDSGTYNYRPAELLATSPDPVGTPNGQFNQDYNQNWRRVVGSASSTATTPGITSGSLSVPGLQASVGNSVLFDLSQATAMGRVTIPGGALTTGNTWYWSGIFRITNISTLNATGTGPGDVGVLLAGFNAGTGPSETTAVNTFNSHFRFVKNANNSNQYFVGAGVTNGGTTFATGAPQNDGDNVFVVVSYSKIAGTNQDQVNLWLNPDPSTFGGTAPSATLNVPYVSGAQLTPASFILRNSAPASTGGRPTVQFDELRVGTTWAEVTPPIPEPCTLWLLLLASLGLFLRRGRG